MLCPYCKASMEHGYIEGGSAEINWKPKKTGIFTSGNADVTDGAVVLSPRSAKTILSKNRVEAYICKKCQKVVINY